LSELLAKKVKPLSFHEINMIIIIYPESIFTPLPHSSSSITPALQAQKNQIKNKLFYLILTKKEK